METRLCKLCGKEFEAPDNRYKYCSATCRDEAKKFWIARAHERERSNPVLVEEARIRTKTHYRTLHNLTPPTCKLCGNMIEDDIHWNQRYHVPCVLKKMLECTDSHIKAKWRSILYNRGYCGEEIREMLKNLKSNMEEVKV